MINPKLISECNGMKCIITSILDPTLSDISNSLVLTLLYILDHPSTRKYLRKSLDMQILMAPFSVVEKSKKVQQMMDNKNNNKKNKNNNINKQQIKQDNAARKLEDEINTKRQIAKKTLMTILKSITGIFYLASDDNCLKHLINLMKLPNKIKELLWARKLMFTILEDCLSPFSNSNKIDNANGPNLVVNYICLILMAFIKNGLIEVM